eukprot:gnl/TRDRNA2_/TRDRNA2_94781_c0_seq1.p1 gnl/TRDRNA2_/TRDRNA2_94781_c0~~gnl/TRDRNA2_/TRDRNA2_94781_c0_seq1.p1  ORF type:complete len:416 (-),score=52.12 gnl/TRDRNA2_/TRDRNA2_94781_c0_seq1:13-1260(-)
MMLVPSSERSARGCATPESQAIVSRTSACRSQAAERPGQRWDSAPDPEKWIEEWERRTAAAMVQDLQNCGADEDLEALRAGWCTQNRSTRSEAPSQLNRRGDTAMRRLNTVGHLRRVAEGKAAVGDVNEMSTPDAAPLQCLQDACAGTGGAQSVGGSRTRPPRPSAKPRVSGGLATKFVDDDEDPWSTWERRWAETFDEMKKMGSSRPRMGRATTTASNNGEEGASGRSATGGAAPRHRGKSGGGNDDHASGAGYSGSASTRSGPASTRPTPPRPPQAPPKPPPRRPTATPPGAAPGRATPPGRPTPRENLRPLVSFASYEEAWVGFEARAADSDHVLTYAEIPWPLGLPAVSGIVSQDGAGERKRKFRAALLRWHPDKWGPLLSRVIEADRSRVTERVKEVTRRILAERETFGG